MTQLVDTNILLNVRPMCFTNKDTGEIVKGIKFFMMRPALNEEFDGYGFVVYERRLMGESAYKEAAYFLEQARNLYGKVIDMTLEVVPTGNRNAYYPLSIAPAKSSVSELKAAA